LRAKFRPNRESAHGAGFFAADHRCLWFLVYFLFVGHAVKKIDELRQQMIFRTGKKLAA